MHKTSAYLLKTFSALFFSIFLPIIAIASLILFVRIAKMTQIIQMDAHEMLLVYAYSLPLILFYALPVTFFAALVLTLGKLSNDFESIVFFSFGISPAKLVRFFLPITFLLLLLLLTLSMALVPISKQLTKSFINNKKMHAVLNIEASQFGQKFGPWLVFLGSKEKKGSLLKNIVLYNADKPQELLAAHKGKFFNEKGILGLRLTNGHAYRIKPDSINQIDYKTMKMYDTSTYKPFTYQNLGNYWGEASKNKKRMKDLLTAILISLFPLATIYFAFAYGILHPRYQKNHGYATILIVTALYYGIVSVVAKTGIVGSALFALSFFIIGAYLFYARVQKRF